MIGRVPHAKIVGPPIKPHAPVKVVLAPSHPAGVSGHPTFNRIPSLPTPAAPKPKKYATIKRKVYVRPPSSLSGPITDNIYTHRAPQDSASDGSTNASWKLPRSQAQATSSAANLSVRQSWSSLASPRTSRTRVCRSSSLRISSSRIWDSVWLEEGGRLDY
jgi:hypothetical protein